MTFLSDLVTPRDDSDDSTDMDPADFWADGGGGDPTSRHATFDQALQHEVREHGEVHAHIDADADELPDDIDLRRKTTTFYGDYLVVDTNDEPFYIRYDQIGVFYPPGNL